MVAPAPAWATSGQELTGRFVEGEIKREPTEDTVVWKLTVAFDQALPEGALCVAFSGVSSVTGLKVTTPHTPVVWTGDGLTTRFCPRAISAGEQVTLEAEFTRARNAAKETATATFTVLGMSGNIIATGSY